MVLCNGSIGSVTGNGHSTNGMTFNASDIHLSDASGAIGEKGQASNPTIVYDKAFAIDVNVEGPVLKTPYVARARDQVHRNENRNAILKFIADNPGSKSLDISRLLGMNLGTLRYHLMILSVNHLVVAYQDGAKHIRYFTNNGSYTKDQMKIISLLKREPTSKLIGALIGKTGMTNAKISKASGLQYSDVNRYLKELMAKGIVIRESLGDEKYQYRIATGVEELITRNALQKSSQ